MHVNCKGDGLDVLVVWEVGGNSGKRSNALDLLLDARFSSSNHRLHCGMSALLMFIESLG